MSPFGASTHLLPRPRATLSPPPTLGVPSARVHIAATRVLETSAEGVVSGLGELRAAVSATDASTHPACLGTVFLHFGVASGYTQFAIERMVRP